MRQSRPFTDAEFVVVSNQPARLDPLTGWALRSAGRVVSLGAASLAWAVVVIGGAMALALAWQLAAGLIELAQKPQPPAAMTTADGWTVEQID